jgi:hypothetical protein
LGSSSTFAIVGKVLSCGKHVLEIGGGGTSGKCAPLDPTGGTSICTFFENYHVELGIEFGFDTGNVMPCDPPLFH